MSSFQEDSSGYRASRGAMEAFNLPGTARREVAEEQPAMRSVGMMSVAPGISTDRIGGGSFGQPQKLGPRVGAFSKMGPPPKGMPAPLKLGGRGPSFGVKQEWEQVITSPMLWDVKSENLGMVPDYPLERTHREIHDTDVSQVANRIAEAVRTLSISTKFDNENAKAKCKTGDLVSFRIRLYAGGEGGQPVVVELQRRSGATSSFMRSCRAILEAAEGGETKAPPSLPPFLNLPAREMKCLKSVQMETSTEKDACEALELALGLFREKNIDSNILGLENMCFLTDPVKTSPVTARATSMRLILGNEKNEIREDVGALLQTDVFPAEPEDEYNNHKEQLRHHALVLFVNTLDVCSKDGSLADAVKSEEWFGVFLIPTLIHYGKRARDCAKNAHLAVSCLSSLAICSDCARQLVVENGGVEALQEAHNFGVQQHELLAEEARRCLDSIESHSTQASNNSFVS